MVCQRFGRDEEKATNILNPTTKVSMQQGFYGAVGVNEFAKRCHVPLMVMVAIPF